MAAEYGNAAARSRYKIFKRLQAAVRQRVRQGDYHGLREEDAVRISRYDPLVELAVMANDPQTPQNVRVLCHLKVAEYIHAPLKATELSLGDGSGGGIVVQIQSFAAPEGRPAQPALRAPSAPEAAVLVPEIMPEEAAGE